MFVAPWLLHRHRKHWENPDPFIPERFLPGDAADIQKYAYIPFSIGPRIAPECRSANTEALLMPGHAGAGVPMRLKPGRLGQSGVPLDAASDGAACR